MDNDTATLAALEKRHAGLCRVLGMLEKDPAHIRTWDIEALRGMCGMACQVFVLEHVMDFLLGLPPPSIPDGDY